MSSDREKEILFDAIEITSPEERARFLRDACAGDDSLRERIESLLAAHLDADEFLGAPTRAVFRAAGDHAFRTKQDEPFTPGATVGPYQLEAVVGEGGFGRVYRATQMRPVVRTVALKVLKSGSDTAAIVARFDAERQVLAVMDHPGVARVYDAGQTDDGRPYVVMEYVDGKPLTTWCDEHAASVGERTRLFESVCLAVQHAHHKGIIHRDLKPSNVLVTEVDGVARAKVIDFGIAKAITPDRPGTSIVARTPALTIEGHLLGTPSYMSPEQIAGELVTDTRSDVYTLGVLLYELLTGTLPFDFSRLDRAPLGEMLRVVREETPIKPSRRVLATHQRLLATAGGTQSRDVGSTRQLAGRLRGDLDWIVMRALEKEPDRRYQSAADLAADLRRALNDEAVEAGPPSTLYRVRKFTRRHRAATAASVLAALAILGGLVSSTIFAARSEAQRIEIARELERSRAYADFATTMFSGVDPAIARGADTTLLRRMITDSEARFTASPPSDPAVRVDVLDLLGTARLKVADFDASIAHFSSATALARDVYGPDHARTLDEREALGEALALDGRHGEARAELDAVLAARARTLGEDHPDTLTALFDLAAIDRAAGSLDVARGRFERVLAGRIRVLGDEHADTMSTRNSLATVLNEMDETPRAIALFQIVLAFQREHLGDDHPHTLATRNNLAGALARTGRDAEAATTLEDVIATKRRVLPADHPSLIVSLNNVSQVYGRLGRADEQREALAEAIASAERALGPEDRRTLILANNLGKLQVQSGRAAEALEGVAAARPIAERTLGSTNALTFALMTVEIGALSELGRHDEAIAIAEELVARSDTALDRDDPDRASHRRALGDALRRGGRLRRAEAVLREAWGLEERGLRDGSRGSARTASLLAEVHDALDQPEEAARWRATADARGG